MPFQNGSIRSAAFRSQRTRLDIHIIQSKNMNMKKILLLLTIGLLILSACAPVLNKNLMKEGTRNVPLAALVSNPEQYRGKLFILGGIIVNTKLTQNGSQVEALYAPVDSRGNLEEGVKYSGGRYLAVYPKTQGLLDPIIYKRNRAITMAGTFVDLQKGKIDDMEYTYPVFEIRQIHLWDEPQAYYMPAYPWYAPYPYDWYNPWWPYSPYPYRYGPPWW